MRDESGFCVSRPFPFPAFPGMRFRPGNEVNLLQDKNKMRFQDFLETAAGNGVETAESLVSTFPYILRIYGGDSQSPTIYEPSHAAPPIPKIIAGDNPALPSSPTILALDLGTHTGWAVSDHGGAITSGTEDFTPHRFEGGGMRYLRFKHWLTELKATLGGIQAVYFEEVRRHKGVDAAHTYGGFMAHLTAWCEHHAIPYQGIPVGTIKKFITGKGNANKEAVMDGVRKRGFAPADDNEADALALLQFIINQPYGGNL